MSDYKWIWEMTLYRKWVLIFLIICNVAGTIYGYDWYSGQHILLHVILNHLYLIAPKHHFSKLIYHAHVV